MHSLRSSSSYLLSSGMEEDRRAIYHRSPSSSFLEEEEEEESESSRLNANVSYQVSISLVNPSPSSSSAAAATAPSSSTTAWREDVCYCFVLVLTFWAFASMTMMFGFFGSTELTFGPNSSWLLQPNSLFVQDIKVSSADSNAEAVVLYGLSSPPSLDLKASWRDTVNTSIAPYAYTKWAYSLNEGSDIKISYNSSSSQQDSAPLILAIIQGKERYAQWIENPTFSYATLSWNFINGSGEIQQVINDSSNYFIALSNIDKMPREAHLEFTIEARLYDTREAHYECLLNKGLCVMKLSFMLSDVAVITTPGPEGDETRREWDVKLAYGPRWATYFVGSGVLTLFILAVFKMISHFARIVNSTVDTVGWQAEGRVATERTPLLASKEDGSSLGSSYDSNSHDDEDDVGGDEEHPQGSGSEHSENLCSVCFDAPKDCFFLPCGHRTTCFTCGTRVAQEAGTCPVCRRKMKKVKKIFTV